MKWVVRAVAMIAASVFCGQAASDLRLPRPPELAPAVAFWTRIYTDVSSNHGLIHDDRNLGRVYARISVPRVLPRSVTAARIDDAMTNYEAVLRALARQSGRPETSMQRRVRELFPDDAPASSFRAAAERLRFQRGLSDRFAAGIRRSGRWLDHIRAMLERHGVPPELASLPHVESSFRPDAVSHAGAAGMWQFTRGTGLRFMRIDPVLDQRRDPWIASEAAARLLAANYAELGQWPLAITAYNHGVNGMRRAVEQLGTTDIARIIAEYDGPYFGFASRNFYPALLAAADVDAALQRHFPGIEREPALKTVQVPVPDYVPLGAVIDRIGVPGEVVRSLNPGLQAALWDGDKYLPEGHLLRLPAGGVLAYEQALASIPPSERYLAQRPDREHVVRSGQTLSQIAARYDVTVGALVAANGLGDRNLIRVGQRLRLPGAGEPPPSLATLAVEEGGARYRIRSGDTLAGIARRFGVSAQALAALNGIANPHLIRAGRSLTIPAATVHPATAVALSDEG
jgi:membrane-bound lytic murein transglycosylase D